ncbi:MAG: DUF5678 domain-containing protein [Candidatus Bathyarchaeia archaeon]
MGEVMLVKELEVYERMKGELLKKYENKVVAIKDEKVIGIYDNEAEALGDVLQKYGYVPVLIKRITREEKVEELPSYTYGLLSITF